MPVRINYSSYVNWKPQRGKSTSFKLAPFSISSLIVKCSFKNGKYHIIRRLLQVRQIFAHYLNLRQHWQTWQSTGKNTASHDPSLFTTSNPTHHQTVHITVLFLPGYKAWKGVSVICTAYYRNVKHRPRLVTQTGRCQQNCKYCLEIHEENEEKLTDYPWIM